MSVTPIESKVEAIYPLDKRRQLLREWKDTDGTVYKVFRLYGEDGSSIDVEYELRYPKSVLRPLDENRRIVAQEKDEEGNLHKLMMTEGEGEVKEYWIDEVLPKRDKRKVRITKPKFPPKKQKKVEQSGSNEAATSDAFLLLLAKTHMQAIKSIIGPIVSTNKMETLPEAFKKLVDHKILSLPVLEEDGTWSGFLDILDVVTWLTDRIGEKALTREDLDVNTITDFRTATVWEAMKPVGSSRTLLVDASVLSVMEELRHTHRVPILRSDGKLQTVVSQSAVIKFIQQNIDLLGEKKNMACGDIFMANQYVMSIREDEKVIDGLRLLRIAGIHAVAVTDKNNERLVGNLSAKDLQKIATNTRFISRLFKPAGEFLKGQEIIFGRPEESLETIINRIVENKLHRIYLVCNDDTLFGVLTLSDILEELILF